MKRQSRITLLAAVLLLGFSVVGRADFSDSFGGASTQLEKSQGIKKHPVLSFHVVLPGIPDANTLLFCTFEAYKGDLFRSKAKADISTELVVFDNATQTVAWL